MDASGGNGNVDYSAQDFRRSRAIIDEAARRPHPPPNETKSNSNMRVRQIGEHRDPYSFYWQLDQLKRVEEERPKRLPPTDYVIDEQKQEETSQEDEEEELRPQTILSPDSHDSGINVAAAVVPEESHYSRPRKQVLPSGWERHEDPSGFSYYWHVNSGTIQREPPPISQRPDIPPPREIHVPIPPPPAPVIIHQEQPPIIEEHAFRQTTTKRRVENSQDEGVEEGGSVNGPAPLRFMVRSLGWVEIPEEQLASTERSTRAVNRAIHSLSSSSPPSDGGAQQKWGDGRELIMELDEQELTLRDPDTLHPLNVERIQHIRVWGIGRDNARDFAYVAKEKGGGGGGGTGRRRFLCHVFRCDTPARNIANALRDICSRLVAATNGRPTSLNSYPRHQQQQQHQKRITKESLLTPTDEPKRVIRCLFIGVTQVPRATGISILNEAVDRLLNQVGAEQKWILADVSIAPSTITIRELNGSEVAQCRVRYLSFLGIGQDVKHCAFIMHTSAENYMCYVFRVEPSAAAMAKTIEAACKLRYQKVLDAHMNKPPAMNGQLVEGDGGESIMVEL